MDHTYISQDSFSVVGYSRTIDPNNPTAIQELWDHFRAQDPREQIANRVNDDWWAVYYDYQGDATQPYKMLVGYRVEMVGTLPEALDLASVPANYYAMFFAQGPLPQAVQDTWQKVKDADITRVYAADFEVYGRFAQDPADAEVPVFVSVENPG